jgi:hypothetical protein
MALSKIDGTNFVDPTLPVASGGTGITSGFVNGLDGWSSSSGNILSADASKGIYLGVNSATADNLLDDYEEGDWTPGLSVSSSGNSGTYVKVGSLVLAKFKVVPTASGTNVTIDSFPFTSDSGFEQQGLARETESAGNLWFIRMPASSTSATIYRYDASNSIDANDTFEGQLIYQTA